MIFAQINKETKKIVMFVGFPTREAAAAHINDHKDCFFIESNVFGSPKRFEYNQESNTIEPKGNQ